MNFKPTEADGNVLDRLEAPEQQARIADVLGRQPGLDQGGLEPVALPRGKRRGEQAAACHDGVSLRCARRLRRSVPCGLRKSWRSMRLSDQRDVAAFACAARGAQRTKMPVP